MRAGGHTGVLTLAAADPANPYGSALPWPEGGRPSRSAGAAVVLMDGALAAFVERGGRRVATFEAGNADLPVLAAALADLASRRRMTIGEIDGLPAEQAPLGRALLAAGLRASYKGLRRA